MRGRIAARYFRASRTYRYTGPVATPGSVLILTQRDIRMNDLRRRCAGTAQPWRCHCGRAAVRSRAVAAHRIIGSCEPSHSAIQSNKNVAKITLSSEA